MQASELGGTFLIGGDMPVHRMGFGAARILGDRGFGPPADLEMPTRVLRHAIDRGIDLIDTADCYGPYLNERQIAAALRPYPKKLVIATKGGLLRFHDPDRMVGNSTPAYLREAIEGSLRRLGLETIDLYQVHRFDGETPIEDTIGLLADLRREGKLRHIGLSEVTVEEIRRAEAVAPIATVQNLYNVLDRQHDDVLAYCEAHGIGFMPWYPLGRGKLPATQDRLLSDIAAKAEASVGQVALAWLLGQSPAMLLIPGTSSVAHLDENIDACRIRLDAADLEMLNGLTPGASLIERYK